MKKYEIWIGSYHQGMGIELPKELELLATIEAISFKVACFKWELMNNYNTIVKTEKAGGYISDQDLEWFYNPKVNGNAWLGKYFESKEEAQKTFK